MNIQKLLTTAIARKVPEITVLFWIIKLCTTAMGESTSDFLVNGFNPYIVVACCFVLFIGALWLQLRSRRYTPWIYWLAVLMVAIFGTMAADVMHVALGIPYILSTILFTIALVGIFIIWQRVEHSLSIHEITTPRRELFYWATVLATFALGTAAGDLFAYTFRLGFFESGVVFAILFAIPALGYLLFRWNAIATFWLAYILTRPVGASFADWTGKALDGGGLGLGSGNIAIALLLVIIVCVGYLTMRSRRSNRP